MICPACNDKSGNPPCEVCEGTGRVCDACGTPSEGRFCEDCMNLEAFDNEIAAIRLHETAYEQENE